MSERPLTETAYKPGDKALILFADGKWRPAELSRGFIWATPDGSNHVAAEGGFDARPLLSTAPASAGDRFYREPEITDHPFDPGYTGMSETCNHLVLRDGYGDDCGFSRHAHASTGENQRNGAP